MDCGANELLCQFLDFVTKNAEHLKDLPKFVDNSWQNAMGEKGWAISFAKDHGEKLIAGASLLFAVWKWWLYNERALHRRLEEYISVSGKRVDAASAQLTEALLRPGIASPLPRPAFALEFQEILRRTRFARTFGLFGLEASANWKLGKDMKSIRNRIKIARDASNSLQMQQVHLFVIAGSLLSAKAMYTKDRAHAVKCTRRALRQFRKVLSTPGHHRHLVAKENEALQLLRLGEVDQARAAFEHLEVFSEDIPEARERDLTAARSKRYRALLRAQAANGQPLGAWILIKPQEQNTEQIGALALRARHIGSYKEWEAIEQAEMHYIAAYIAHRCNYSNHEPEQLKAAEEVYSSVRDELPLFWFLQARTRRLRKAAMDGLNRIQAAPNYDMSWLCIH